MIRVASMCALLMLVTTTVVVVAQGGQMTREEALAAVFPNAGIEAERVFLTEQQMVRIGELAGGDMRSALVARYVATQGGRTVGRAYIDTHVVRTKMESLLISLEPDGSVKRIEVTAFQEPPEYQPAQNWLQQYYKQLLTDDLAVQRAIQPILGGTLTTGAANAAVRRVLAMDQVLEHADEKVEALAR
ncbi:MAG: hypothetical protein P8J30_10920 [Ilumatobacter sp.]|nr:hypothetical protein [Ilumatobacter sp.]